MRNIELRPRASPFYADDVFPHFFIQEEIEEEDDTNNQEERINIHNNDSNEKRTCTAGSKILRIRRKVWDGGMAQEDDVGGSICSYSDDEYDEENDHSGDVADNNNIDGQEDMEDEDEINVNQEKSKRMKKDKAET
eukprot:5993584-Ditylum_brightwellii.AAC.1